MKIYISGKITDLSESEYKKNFFDAAKELLKMYDDGKYHTFLSPIDLTPFLGIKCWLCYMITDIYYLKKCDAIALQINWEESKGAFIEHFIAKFIFRQKVIKLKTPTK